MEVVDASTGSAFSIATLKPKKAEDKLGLSWAKLSCQLGLIQLEIAELSIARYS